ncbi:MAG: hypothetical protein LKF36_00620 [Lactobacillus sp.]|jgi:hypothetical protein|nr:hypothetical protein [Lactobacillus sp.]
MKLRTLFISLAIAFGVLVIGANPVNATGPSRIEPSKANVYSGYAPLKIYSDPECTQFTGNTLSKNVEVWKTFQMYYTGDPYINPKSFDLGANQWISSADVDSIGDNNNEFLAAYSDYKSVPVYSDPQFKYQMSTLNPEIAYWKITRYTTYFDGYAAIDLGHNQWVKYTDIRMIPEVVFTNAGMQLVNSQGIPTSSIQVSGDYKVFSAQKINGVFHLNLGNDNQWRAF